MKKKTKTDGKRCKKKETNENYWEVIQEEDKSERNGKAKRKKSPLHKGTMLSKTVGLFLPCIFSLVFSLF